MYVIITSNNSKLFYGRAMVLNLFTEELKTHLQRCSLTPSSTALDSCFRQYTSRSPFNYFGRSHCLTWVFTLYATFQRKLVANCSLQYQCTVNSIDRMRIYEIIYHWLLLVIGTVLNKHRVKTVLWTSLNYPNQCME